MVSLWRSWLVTFSLLAAASSPTIAQPNDLLIVPGQRLGRWELGKPLAAYDLGQPGSHTEQKTRDIAWNDYYTFNIRPENLNLWVYTCKIDSLVFAIMAARPINRATELTEATKYKTAEGIGIRTDEGDVLRLLGQPPNSFDSRQVVDGVEVTVKVYEYVGLRIRIPQTDRKVHALGATTRGGFAACQQAVLGGPTSVQQPPTTPAGMPVNVALPVPMPADLRIIAPAPDIPVERAAYSGVWVGKWENILDTALAVQEITPAGVSAVYAWGVAPQWNIRQAGWVRRRGRFVGTELHLIEGILTIYRMRPDGRLDAEFQGQQLTKGVLNRVFPPR